MFGSNPLDIPPAGNHRVAPLARGNLKDQSILVHELVHHNQRCDGVEMTGNNFYQFDQTEVEAIAVQCR